MPNSDSESRTKWAVLHFDQGQAKYICGRDGSIAWTYDRAKAQRMAGMDGLVVDAEKLSEAWGRGEQLPEVADWRAMHEDNLQRIHDEVLPRP